MKIFTNFAIETTLGRFAEWLGAGLQNRLQRFESATDLNQIPFREAIGDFYWDGGIKHFASAAV